MLMVEDATFFAWLDGELPPEEAARIEAEVALDPRLSRLAEEHRAMTAGLRNAFGQVTAQPVPQRIQNASRPTAQVVSLADGRGPRSVRKAPSIWVQMGALAATLVVGIVTGNLLRGLPMGGSSSPVVTQGGQLVASAGLDNALAIRLASRPADTGPRIGLTFRDKAGAICRTFEDKAASGLACREDGHWHIRSLFQAPERQTTDYRMASGPDPRLMEEVDAAIEGEPFDAAQEKSAMQKGWR
jgi:hypothetical protein